MFCARCFLHCFYPTTYDVAIYSLYVYVGMNCGFGIPVAVPASMIENPPGGASGPNVFRLLGALRPVSVARWREQPP